MPLDQTKNSFEANRETCEPSLPWKSSGAIEVTLADQIKRIAEPLLRSLGLELFDLCFTGSQRGGHLQIFIDKQGGVTLSDCEKFSRLLGQALDVDDFISDNYTLEVSSPGLDRPLREKADYHRFKGKRVRIKTVLKIENQKVFIGELVDCDEKTVVLLVDGGQRQEIPFDQIAHARLEIEWVAGKNRGGLRK